MCNTQGAGGHLRWSWGALNLGNALFQGYLANLKHLQKFFLVHYHDTCWGKIFFQKNLPDQMECILKNTYPVESEVHHVQVFHKMKCLSTDMGILILKRFAFYFLFFISYFFGVISIGYVLGITMKKWKIKKGSVGFLYFYPWSQGIPEITALQAEMVISSVAWIYRIPICILAGMYKCISGCCLFSHIQHYS